ncbi:MAG: Nif3-like dinuclear metal center hexameric protein [Bacteroidetes bacterium]|nr:Nif3-like dinuclear metal center hexameric protein [Bacteroidota bacterium]HRT52995.1 Nif3-like dinuclear metal center hexameric protein [Flavobacteriales bacterium]
MKISDITTLLESWAPPALQEDYDNSGLQVGTPDQEVRAALIALDCTEEVVAEAVRRGCDLVIAHHPVIFRGIKSLTGRTGVERTLLAAIRHNVAIYAIHTNLDNVISGVNAEIAARLGLQDLRVLDPKPHQLRKLVVFVPHAHAEAVRSALFGAGAGRIGAYDECSYNLTGEGTFRGGEGTNAFVGTKGERHTGPETRIETVFHAPLERTVLAAMLRAHPYEEVAYDIYPLANTHPGVGSGAIGRLSEPMDEEAFLDRVKEAFGVPALKHTALRGRPVEQVAVCGGSGAFLIGRARAAGADVFVTADVKYHEFFGAEGQLVVADIGHYESEQFTMHLLQRQLRDKLPTFAAHLTETVSNPVHVR